MRLSLKIKSVWRWVSGSRRTRIALLLLLVLGALSLLLWKVPQWQLLGHSDLMTKDRVSPENELRKTLAQILAGLFVFVGGYFAWRRVAAAEQTVLVTQEGQITERFTRAIQQLGDKDNLAIRLGGIFALERIARDSRKDHWTIMEILTAYVRGKAPWIESAGTSVPPDEIRPPADIEAILTVIGRRNRSYEEGNNLKLDLSGSDLRRAFLMGTHLEQANLAEVHFEGALLGEAHLEGAHLWKTHFNGAYLKGAHLNGAFAYSSDFEKAELSGAVAI